MEAYIFQTHKIKQKDLNFSCPSAIVKIWEDF